MSAFAPQPAATPKTAEFHSEVRLGNVLDGEARIILPEAIKRCILNDNGILPNIFRPVPYIDADGGQYYNNKATADGLPAAKA